jgi:hypothetical protein
LPSATNAQAYRINLNTAKTEYLLIENRQPLRLDLEIPPGTDGKIGGLLVLHVDGAVVRYSNTDLRLER